MVFFRGPSLVRLGDQNLATTNDGARPIEVNVKQFIKHPMYNKKRDKENDIALIELVKEVIFDKSFIRPACLQQNEDHHEKLLAVRLFN